MTAYLPKIFTTYNKREATPSYTQSPESLVPQGFPGFVYISGALIPPCWIPLPLILKRVRFGGFAPLYHRPASHEGKDMDGFVCAAHRRKIRGFSTRFHTVLGAPGRA